MHKCVESTPVRIQAKKRIDIPKNVRRNGSGKRDDECQNGISEPVGRSLPRSVDENAFCKGLRILFRINISSYSFPLGYQKVL